MEKVNLNNRVGKFTVSDKLLFDTIGFFKPFNIIDANSHIMADEVEYFAVSPLFDVISEGENIPEYFIDCEQDRMGNLIWKVERQ